MKKFLSLICFIFILPAWVHAQWLPVQQSNTSDYNVYVNASGNDEYQFVKQINRSGIESCTIYSDGSIGATYPSNLGHYNPVTATCVSPDTTILMGTPWSRNSYPKLDTYKIAILIRGQVIMLRKPNLYMYAQSGLYPEVFKVGSECIDQ